MTITVKMRGTCGELSQGFYRGEPILITCPIEKFSTVTISDEFAGVEGLGEKSLAMLDKILKYFRADFKFGLRLTSELPRGKGMASSSADLAAVAQAVANFLGKTLSPAETGRLCAKIEPTDGIFYEGVVVMNPLTGQLIKKIHVEEKFPIAIFDYGGEVNTLKFNRRSDFEFPTLDDRINFKLIKKSALANQKILPKRGLEELMNFAETLGAVAVNVAHSGTVTGIFFRENDSRVEEKIAAVQSKFDFLKFLMLTRLAI
ncbi:MAG: GHMP kinase [Selenomonadaceae bacterium]|nr:GHMP kinase [Selenomonadaceae bacterium]